VCLCGIWFVLQINYLRTLRSKCCESAVWNNIINNAIMKSDAVILCWSRYYGRDLNKLLWWLTVNVSYIPSTSQFYQVVYAHI